MTDDGIAKLAKELVAAQAKAEAETLADELVAKCQGEKAAGSIVSRAVARWTGHQVRSDGSVPIVRQGRVVGWIGAGSAGAFGLDTDHHGIGSAIWLEPTSKIRARQIVFEKLSKLLHEAQSLLGDLSLEDRLKIDTTSERSPPQDLSSDIIELIGPSAAFSISAMLISVNLKAQIARCQLDLADREPTAGRSRIEARYKAAERLAKIYAKVTGKRPTYSQDGPCLHGDFTPVLRDLFDAMTWKGADLRGPAEAAVAAIVEDDLCAPNNSPSGLLSALRLPSTDPD